MSEPIHIAILECDTPLDKVRSKYGGYGEIFTKLLEGAAKELTETKGKDVKVKCSVWDVVEKQEYPEDLEDVDAVLMTGSSEYIISFLC